MSTHPLGKYIPLMVKPLVNVLQRENYKKPFNTDFYSKYSLYSRLKSCHPRSCFPSSSILVFLWAWGSILTQSNFEGHSKIQRFDPLNFCQRDASNFTCRSVCVTSSQKPFDHSSVHQSPESSGRFRAFKSYNHFKTALQPDVKIK